MQANGATPEGVPKGATTPEKNPTALWKNLSRQESPALQETPDEKPGPPSTTTKKTQGARHDDGETYMRREICVCIQSDSRDTRRGAPKEQTPHRHTKHFNTKPHVKHMGNNNHAKTHKGRDPRNEMQENGATHQGDPKEQTPAGKPNISIENFQCSGLS